MRWRIIGMKKNQEPALTDINRGKIIGCQVISKEQYIQIKGKMSEQPTYDFLCRFQDDTYIEIQTKEQLQEMIEKINGGDKTLQSASFRLCQDIDLKGTDIKPCGVDEACCFSGIFDGQGHTISNGRIISTGQKYSGFFGWLKDAVIYNLNVEGMAGCDGEAVLFAEKNKDSVIQHCRYHGTVMVGDNEGVILECTLKAPDEE